MKTALLFAGAALALILPGTAAAQHQGHAPPPPPTPPEQAIQRPQPAPPRPEAHQDHAPLPEPDRGAATGAHAGHGDSAEGSGTPERMMGALGPYPMAREASGTAWQPDSSQHGGLHLESGNWSLTGHAMLHAVYDWQSGPRGDRQGFVAGMVMGSARRPIGERGTLQLRAMLSPDPLMGRRGYPLHLAAGETADGMTVLVDRQHPHDFFMELAASYSHRFSERVSGFLYAGLPGEPAFGPPAFMHRMSIMDSPEAPITHHWLDSTHISFGVLTAGLVAGDVKIELSRFNGREPDQRRWNIETGPLDSTAVRVSWNPTPTLSLQGSWGRFIAPEQLEPDEDETRWSASLIHTRSVGRDGWWSSTLAWARRSDEHGEHLNAAALESAVGLGLWTLFGRAEWIETEELLGHHGPIFEVAKISVGMIRDFRVAPNARLGVGGLYAFNFLPGALEASYAGDPHGAMLFVRLRID